MEDLKKLNIEFKQYLEGISGQLTDNLIHLLKGENIQYLGAKGPSDIKALYFEYEYEYLNIICWGVDRTGRISTETLKLPDKKTEAVNETEKWNALHLLPAFHFFHFKRV